MTKLFDLFKSTSTISAPAAPVAPPAPRQVTVGEALDALVQGHNVRPEWMATDCYVKLCLVTLDGQEELTPCIVFEDDTKALWAVSVQHLAKANVKWFVLP